MPNFAQIGYKRVSDNNDYAGTFPFSEAANPKVGFDKISANEYVACYYNSGWWVGLVQDVNCDEKGVEIIFYTIQDPYIALLGQREKTFVWYHV